MTLNQILDEQMKELDEKFPVGKYGITHVLVDALKFHIKMFSRKLIESLAEEILGEDDEKEVFWKEGCHDVEVECDNSSRNLLRAEQRLKVKEILQNISK